jgi:murein DD-endopeptidase MepM/ murein hydrolase activator NlpD
MSKFHYQFNTKSLRIERVKVSLKDRLKRLFSALGLGLVFAMVILVIAYNFLSSPKERILQREVEQYKLQYKILNDRFDNVQNVLSELQDRDDNIYRVIFEAEPISTSIRKAGYGGSDRYSKLGGYENSDVIINTLKKLDNINSQIYVQSKSFDEVFKMAKDQEKMIASIPAIQPVDMHDLKRIGSHFGYRTDPFYKVRKMHEGIDFTASIGTPVFATGDGVVSVAEYSNGGYGIQVCINHGYNYETVYAHLSKFIVKVGERVKRGEVIAYVGNTGKSTAPHLHYEVRKEGLALNPINFFFNDITPAEYTMLIEMSAQPSQTMD